MKNFFNITSLIILVSLVACKDDNEKSARDLKINMITTASWGNAQVTHSDGDLSEQYADFAIVFSRNASDGFDGTFLVFNGGYAFSENAGKWKFSDDLDQVIFDSGKEMDIQLDEDHLQLDFTVPPSGGKVVGLSGHFVFDLQPM